MIILEGADALGKTTMATSLISIAKAKGHTLIYRHMQAPSKGFDIVHGYAPYIQANVVQDRFHLGSIVWQNNITNEMQKIIELQLQKVVIVVLYTSDEAWYRPRLAEDAKAQLYATEQIIRANREYAKLSAGTHSVHIRKPDFIIDIKNGLWATNEQLNGILNLWSKLNMQDHII